MSESKDLEKKRVQRPSPESRKDPKKFTRLEALECYQQVATMLKHGYQYMQIAEFIQKNGEYDDIQQKSLAKILSDYEKERIDDVEKVAHRSPRNLEESLDNLDHDVDVLNELGKLYKLQMERIDLNVKREKQVGMVFKTTGKEVQVALDILREIGSFKQSTGMLKKNLGTLSVEARATVESEDMTGVPSGFIQDPRKRNQILQFVERLENTDPLAVEQVVSMTREEEKNEDIEDAEYEEVDSD
jgi:hypothetical protein